MLVHFSNIVNNVAYGTGKTYTVYPDNGKRSFYYVTVYANGTWNGQTFYYRGEGYCKQQCIRTMGTSPTSHKVLEAIKQFEQSQGV